MPNINRILQDYLRKDIFEAKFNPVERIVYGFVGLVLVTVVVALLKLIFIK